MAFSKVWLLLLVPLVSFADIERYLEHLGVSESFHCHKETYGYYRDFKRLLLSKLPLVEMITITCLGVGLGGSNPIKE